MAIEATLTLKKLLMLIVVGICSLVWIVGGILDDIDDLIVLESATHSRPQSNQPGPIIGAGSNNLHWFVQVIITILVMVDN